MSELQGLLLRLWADLIARPGGPLEFRFLLLGFVPYLLIRGPTDRITRRRQGGIHGEANQTQHPRHLGG
jgi:hypothetical protein